MPVQNIFSPEQQAEVDVLDRKQQIANALLGQGLNPQQGRMIGNVFVPPNPLQQVVSGLGGFMAGRKLDDQRADLVADAQVNQKADLNAITRAMSGRTIDSTRAEPEANPQAALRGILPSLESPFGQQVAQNQIMQGLAPKKPMVVGKTLMSPEGQVIASDPTVAAENEANRAARAAQAEEQRLSREAEARRQREFQASEGEKNRQAREELARLAASLKGEKPVTEAQGKAGLYGSRAAISDRVLQDLEEKINISGLAVKQSAGDIPIIGGLAGAAGNAMLSKEQQRVEQAQRDFVNAVLRQESGAVIAKEEFDNAKKQYFPQPGDSKEVIAQKRINRQAAIQGFRTMAGPAAADIDAALQGTPNLAKQQNLPKPPQSRDSDAPPAGVAPELWKAMTPQERALWRK